jgi:selenide,water dikinase
LRWDVDRPEDLARLRADPRHAKLAAEADGTLTVKRLVLIGGGHAHVEVLRRFALAAAAEIEIVLISPARYAIYSGMLPGLIAGHYARRDTQIDLERLGHAARARVMRDMAVGLDLERRVVLCTSGEEVSFDLVSLDIGSVANTEAIRQAERIGLPVKPVERLLARCRVADRRGAGARRWTSRSSAQGPAASSSPSRSTIGCAVRRPSMLHAFPSLPSRGKILPGYAAAVRSRVLSALAQREIVVHVERRVVGVGDRGIALDNSERIAADRVIWVTGPAPVPWLQQSGLATDAAWLRAGQRPACSRSLIPKCSPPAMWATMVDHPRPKVRRVCRATGAAAYE